ncbi:response regulator [Lyngbya confervoides]|uniref:Response regulator n=1 Tax=Lyngbya confervoides BDU141951 TaxID=1574623 RepID=A0ABD4T8Q6_9CYAN|nr:response regulator [Lyngbya confervoides]MCM1984695.1 response regulator [Lyngbya confervoides BDU141951]
MIRLLLVDDQKTIRESLRYMLKPTADIQVVGTANNGHMALEQIEILQPDVVLIDMEMPDLDGLSATRLIRQRFPETKVLVLSIHDSDDYVAKAWKAGAMGYLLKNTPADQLRESIRFVHLGYAQFGPGVVEKVMPVQSVAEGTSDPESAAVNGKGHPSQEGASGGSSFLPNYNEWLFGSNMRDLRSQLADALDAPTIQSHTPPTVSVSGQEVQPARALPISWKGYVGLGVLLNGLFWGAGLAYLINTPPTYTSHWTLSLPPSSSSTNVSLPDVGEARSQSDSPFNSSVSDPRENYKFLLGTDEVRSMVATLLNRPNSAIETPTAKILANTTLMQISIEGPSGIEAQQVAVAFQEALLARVEQLRETETNQEGNALQQSYDEAQEKLERAQGRLAAFKAQSGLGASGSITDLTTNIEGLRRQESETIARLQEVSANTQQLSSALGLSPQQAVDAVALKSDPLFQKYLSAYSNANSALIDLTAQYSDAHPSVANKQEERANAQARLQEQARTILGRLISLPELSQLSLETGVGTSERSELFQQLIQLQSEERGLNAQAQGLKTQIQRLEIRLKDLNQKAARLTSLQRDVQRAEAVFSSTATRLDLSNSNPSATYPPITVVAPPNLPDEPSAPKTKLAIAGLVMSSLFICSAIAMLIWRTRRQVRDHSEGTVSPVQSTAIQTISAPRPPSLP